MSETGPVQYDPYGEIVVATVQGMDALDAMTAGAFGNAVMAYVAERPGVRLLLNLHHVRYISSAGISEIIRISKALESQGGSLRVCGAEGEVYRVFEVTNLAGLFHVEANVREAAEHFLQALKGQT